VCHEIPLGERLTWIVLNWKPRRLNCAVLIEFHFILCHTEPMSQSLAAVVLCAGKGTRMKSDKAKVLHPILGKPLAYYPISRAFEIGAANVVAVIGHQGETVQRVLSHEFRGYPISFATQVNQRGTGDAVNAAREALKAFSGAVMLLYGDVPLLTQETLKRLVSAFSESKSVLALVSCHTENPKGYGRVVKNAQGFATHIVEEKDCSAEQKKITEINAGIYVADSKFLWEALAKLTPNNAAGELYLTDIVAQASKLGNVIVVDAPLEETAGVNDRVELSARGEVLKQRINERHMRQGVSFIDIKTTYIEEGAEIGEETILGPNVSISSDCNIGSRVTIGQGSVLTNTTVGDDCEIKPYSVLEESVVGIKCHVGPFARLRPGTILDEAVHVGNFVETKKAHLRKGTKAGHLAYLGDAEIGMNCNIGAGTITCNYDGVNKHVTTLGNNVFVGSDTQLVAPVTLGNDVFVGAGSTVTEDVPAGSLALSRAPMTIKEGWAERRKKVLEGLKK
jgi:bifunctional UDP-N-acetylglucosamine pyrophosphorylase / glucosamine-1-phosphate N-acetyltransferase